MVELSFSRCIPVRRRLAATWSMVLVSALAVVGTSHAETIHFRTEQAGSQPNRDGNLHFLAGPTDAAFASPFTSADFGNAVNGPAAYVVAPHTPFWLYPLPADPAAVWVSDGGTAIEGGSALYALRFYIQAPFSKATLHLAYSVDNLLGTPRPENRPGLYLNDVPLAATAGRGGYGVQDTIDRDVSNLLVQGDNTLFFYDYDYGYYAGLMLSGSIATDGVNCSGTSLSLNPRRTYLRTRDDLASLGPLKIELASLGVTGGMGLVITRQGSFAYAPNGTQTGHTLDGVFSSDSTVLDSSHVARVPGALSAGDPYVTAPSFFDGLTTDIPQDFAVTDSVIVTVPIGATFLMIGTDDNFFGDNEDPDGDLRVTVRPLCEAAGVEPEGDGGHADRLLRPSPNPARDVVRFDFDLAKPGLATLAIFDVAGRLVATPLGRTPLDAGRHSVEWDPTQARRTMRGGGVAFALLEVDGRPVRDGIQRFIVLK